MQAKYLHTLMFFMTFVLLSLTGLAGCSNGNDEKGSGKAKITTPPPSIKFGQDFALLDHKGEFRQLSYHSDKRAIVLFSHGVGCPIVRHLFRDYETLARQYEEQGVVFYMINAFPQDDRDKVIKEAEEFGITVPILMDESQMIAKSLGITRTGETLVIDTDTWEVVYRGPVNDRAGYETVKDEAQNHYLAAALDNVIANEPVEYSGIEFRGCAIAYDEYKPGELTYTKDVAPILENRCADCHQPGAIGPWAMTEYAVIKGWSAMIKDVLRTRRMPPWHADNHFGDLIDKVSMPPEEVKTVIEWIDSGMAYGDGPDPLEKFKNPEFEEWPLGKPDLVIEAGQQEIPATGLLPYYYEYQHLEFKEDKWLKAIHLRPVNRKVLHHGFVFVIPPNEYQRTQKHKVNYDWSAGVFATYLPGIYGEISPKDALRFIPKGSRLKWEMHYTTTGKPETDNPQLGLYFADAPSKGKYRFEGISERWFRVPAYHENWEVKAERTFDEPIMLYELMPHMHYRGKNMLYTIVYPDGKENVVLSVPNYNFNWQRQYQLTEPMLLPAGTTIKVKGAFDNSVKNPFNPDPSAYLTFGGQSFDEMFIGYITFSYLNP